MFEQAVDAQVLLLIEKLSTIEEVSKLFYLAGGTGLALHLGHRKSEDIDLFTPSEGVAGKGANIIGSLGGQILIDERNTVHGIVDGVKVSFILYPYEIMGDFSFIRAIRIASLQDIACMKTIAIAQRAEKKDFFDMFEICKFLTPGEIRKLIIKKYGEKRLNCYHILKSFLFFDDAESSPDPISLTGTTWKQVKEFFIANEKKLSDDLMC